MTLTGIASTLALCGSHLTKDIKDEDRNQLNFAITDNCPHCEKHSSKNNSNLKFVSRAKKNINISTLEETHEDIAINENLENSEYSENQEIDENYNLINNNAEISIPSEENTNIEENINQENNNAENNEITNENDITEQKEVETDISTTNYDYTAVQNDYLEIKSKLNEAIELSNKYKECNNDCFDLTEEEKQTLENNYEELNRLIEDLEDCNNNILCCLTNGEYCEDDDDHELSLINLERRLNAMQSAINQLNFLTGRNPNISFYSNPYSNIYGYSYRFYPQENLDETNEESENTDSQNNNDATTTSRKNIDTYVKLSKPSNLDTYGPKDRNIDTFFNTALLDENMFDYNGGYGMNNYGYVANPYMYGGKINGYNFDSNNGYYNPNFNNNNQEKNSNENTTSNNTLSIDSNDQIKEPKKIKFGKNIDTYSGKTIEGNINTMGGKKVTDYIKEKFNKIFRKNKDNSNEINDYVDNFIEENKNNENNSNLIENNNEKIENNQINTENKDILNNITNLQNNFNEEITENKLKKIDKNLTR